MSLSYNSFFSSIKTSIIRRNLNAKVKYTRKFYNLVLFLYKEGLISGYFIDQSKKEIIIYLKYYANSNLLSRIKVYKNDKYKSSFKTIKELNKFAKYGNFLCVSTNRGLLTLGECIIFNVGGRIIFELS